MVTKKDFNILYNSQFTIYNYHVVRNKAFTLDDGDDDDDRRMPECEQFI